MKKNFLLNAFLLGLLALGAGPSGDTKTLNPAAPSVIPGTTAEMTSPGFWISRLPKPDQVILGRDQVMTFNHILIKRGLIKNLLDIQESDIEAVKESMAQQIYRFRHSRFFDSSGKQVPDDFMLDWEKAMAFSKDHSDWQYGFIIKNSDQRLLPTDEILTKEPWDLDFDEVQNSTLDVGTPVVVIYESQNKLWALTISSASIGWVKRQGIEICSREEFQNIQVPAAGQMAVVTAAKVDLYGDAARTKFYATVHMGARFKIKEHSDNGIEVFVSPRKSAFIQKGDFSIGYLTYSPRTIMEQAFKLLNAPYGWGGQYGEQDCSAFLKYIFATVGIDLPRNSSEQGLVGKTVKKLAKAMPGITVAQLKGHIVLYLGMVDGRPFAIHETYSYRELVGSIERTRVVNRAIVSDLNLGKGTKKGSLADRIVSIREYR